MDEPSRFEVVRRRAAKLLSGLVLGLLVVLALSQVGGLGGLPRGTPAPKLDATLLDGSRVRVDGRVGEVLVLNFWASWCPPCRAEAPTLTALHARLTREGVGRVVGLNVEGDPPGRVQDAAARLGLLFPVGLAPDAAVRAWNVERLPTTYVLSPEGRIAAAIVGEARPAALDAAVRAARAGR